MTPTDPWMTFDPNFMNTPNVPYLNITSFKLHQYSLN